MISAHDGDGDILFRLHPDHDSDHMPELRIPIPWQLTPQDRQTSRGIPSERLRPIMMVI